MIDLAKEELAVFLKQGMKTQNRLKQYKQISPSPEFFKCVFDRIKNLISNNRDKYY